MTTTATVTLYAFSELDAAAQERAIETACENAAKWLEPWELDDSDYWQERFLDPVGAEFETKTVSLMNGKTRQEPAIYWDSYPWTAYFVARVDLEPFIRSQKLGRSLALLLSAIKRGEIVPYTYVGTTDSRPWSGRDWHAEIETDFSYGYGMTASELARASARHDRIDAQIADLQERIDDWYEETASEIASLLESQYEYLTSEESARELLQDDPDAIFLESGEEYAYR